MSPFRIRLAGWILSPMVALAAGCTFGVAAGPGPEMAVADDGTVYPATPPPDPIPELPPPSPGYDFVWINGYWDWTGADWNWYSGYWVPRAEASLYVGPRFVFVEGRPVYYRGYWRGDGGRRVYGYGWRGAPPPAYRARPQVPPSAWRAQHNEGWRSSPGAGAWRGNAGGPHGFEQHPGGPPHAGPGPHPEPGHPGWGHPEPGPGGMHPGPGGPGGMHPGPGGPGGMHPGPAPGAAGFAAHPGPPAAAPPPPQHHPGPPPAAPARGRKK